MRLRKEVEPAGTRNLSRHRHVSAEDADKTLVGNTLLCRKGGKDMIQLILRKALEQAGV